MLKDWQIFWNSSLLGDGLQIRVDLRLNFAKVFYVLGRIRTINSIIQCWSRKKMDVIHFQPDIYYIRKIRPIRTKLVKLSWPRILASHFPFLSYFLHAIFLHPIGGDAEFLTVANSILHTPFNYRILGFLLSWAGEALLLRASCHIFWNCRKRVKCTYRESRKKNDKYLNRVQNFFQKKNKKWRNEIIFM